MASSLDTRIPPLLLTLLVGMLMATCAWAFPSAGFHLPARWWIGMAVGLAGAGVMVAAALRFRRQGTTLDPRDPGKSQLIVSDGVFAFTRNPMYLGMALILLGWALALSSVVALVWVPLFVLYIDRWQIQPEERMLSERFGQPYLDYLSRVRRWL
ncbi:isoprenylcysteine carboxylmethyltransferase family protein [Hydrogenophaga sp. 5NK40-0174]|uniref:methyltransferase family protein n=1 Tax=Hydrogenophaga sp. 5NK40-0174 TaxID=3127649 RepID=UPI0031059C57